MSREVAGSPHHASLNSRKKLVLFTCTFFRISKMPQMETTFQKEGEYRKGGVDDTLRSCSVHRSLSTRGLGFLVHEDLKLDYL